MSGSVEDKKKLIKTIENHRFVSDVLQSEITSLTKTITDYLIQINELPPRPVSNQPQNATKKSDAAAKNVDTRSKQNNKSEPTQAGNKQKNASVPANKNENNAQKKKPVGPPPPTKVNHPAQPPAQLGLNQTAPQQQNKRDKKPRATPQSSGAPPGFQQQQQIQQNQQQRGGRQQQVAQNQQNGQQQRQQGQQKQQTGFPGAQHQNQQGQNKASSLISSKLPAGIPAMPVFAPVELSPAVKLGNEIRDTLRQPGVTKPVVEGLKSKALAFGLVHEAGMCDRVLARL